MNFKAAALGLLVTLSSVSAASAYQPCYPGDQGNAPAPQPQVTRPTPAPRVATNNCWWSNGQVLKGSVCQISKGRDHEGDLVHYIRQGGDTMRVVLWKSGAASISYNGGEWQNDWSWERDSEGDYKVGQNGQAEFAFTAAR